MQSLHERNEHSIATKDSFLTFDSLYSLDWLSYCSFASSTDSVWVLQRPPPNSVPGKCVIPSNALLMLLLLILDVGTPLLDAIFLVVIAVPQGRKRKRRSKERKKHIRKSHIMLLNRGLGGTGSDDEQDEGATRRTIRTSRTVRTDRTDSTNRRNDEEGRRGGGGVCNMMRVVRSTCIFF